MAIQTFHIKNMVCDRCKAAVRAAFEKEGIKTRDVELGLVQTDGCPDEKKIEAVTDELKSLGFELLRDSRRQTAERIKALVIEMLRYGSGKNQTVNVSVFLADKMHSEYSALSKLFSAETGMTIEKYVIAQKVELAKELLSYGELSLTEIAARLNYSSVAYLSAQFKTVTGMTPSQYKNSGKGGRRELDKI